jgi:hypothetical protein
MNKPTKDQQIRELQEALMQQDQVCQVLAERDQKGRRLIWQLVKHLGGVAVIPATPTPILWKLEFQPVPDGTLALTASEMPEPTRDQLDRLANELRGTEKNLAIILENSHLKEYPPQAIEHMLAKDHVIFVNPTWLDADIARTMQQQGGDAGKN